MSPEYDRRRLRELIRSLKRTVPAETREEIKLREIKEEEYFEFLKRLGALEGVLYAVATDAGLNEPATIIEHRKIQAEKIVEHKDKMLHQNAREGLQMLAARVASLAPQLYVQLQCQLDLIARIILSGVLYFVQRTPMHLGRFRWRLDQKNSEQTEYEKAFATVTPAFLQTVSLSEPMPMLIGADYSAFSRFDYTEESRPRYLRETYGLDVDEDKPVTNIGLLMREDFEFVDSKQNIGVQVADLLASGIRRCLRQGFSNNDLAAHLIGRLMVQGYQGHLPIKLRGFSKSEEPVTKQLARLLRIMEQHCRAMLIR
jgi:uncharacterized protein DUF3800